MLKVIFSVLLLYQTCSADSYWAVGVGYGLIFNTELHQVCPKACDKASIRAFAKAQKICDKEGGKSIEPVHGECFTEPLWLGCRGRYPLEFTCK